MVSPSTPLFKNSAKQDKRIVDGLPIQKFRIQTHITGRAYGERRAQGTGESIEFHDFREYQPGDEPRAIDWRTYARTRRLYTRLYRSERTVHAHFIIDTSASMSLFGKAERAQRLAELLARIALQEMSVQFHTFTGSHSLVATRLREFPALISEPLRTPSDLPEATLLPGNALRVFAQYIAQRPGRSLVVILSDFLDPNALKPALTELRHGGSDIVALQILAAEEWDPTPGTVELVDIESGDRLAVDSQEAERYREEIRTFVRERRREVRAVGGRHVLLPVTDTDRREELLTLLRAGIINRH